MLLPLNRGAGLLDQATVGQIDEPLTTFGLRFHLLLESQPVYGADAYRRLLEAVVERYAREYVALDPTKEWTYLLNDLIRYFHSLGIAYQWESIDGDHWNWRLRNVKFRHSRLVIYAGMLCLLGECSRERGDKVGWLTARLGLTPLERIAWVYAAEGDPHFERIARCYDTFLAAIGDPTFRHGLQELPSADVAIARRPIRITCG